MRGHAEHDDMKYVPREMLEEWAARDPLARYERQLLESGVATRGELDQVSAELDAFVLGELAWAEASPMPDPQSGLDGVYADRPTTPPTPPLVAEWERRKKERG
jgi:TPP-dependent pyruvate/acetoin dehydrogenase alpha subunit